MKLISPYQLSIARETGLFLIFLTFQPCNQESLTFWKTLFWSLHVLSKLWNLPQKFFRICQIHCAAFRGAGTVKLPSKIRSGVDSSYIQFQMNKFIHEQIKFKIKTWVCANISNRVSNGMDFVTLKVYELWSNNRCIWPGAKVIYLQYLHAWTSLNCLISS